MGGGTFGSDDGQFITPQGVAVDSYGNVYVADWNNDRIQKFDSSGNFLLKWGSFGSGNGEFFGVDGVAVDSSDNVYVSDGNDRIQKFDSNGSFLLEWGTFGSGDGQFDSPEGVAVDGSGNIYVADTDNHRIQKFSTSMLSLEDIFGGVPIEGFPGWRASPWYLNYNVDFWPWIFHDEHGWQFVDSGSTEAVIFVWDFGLGEWLFLNENTYRWMFLFWG